MAFCILFDLLIILICVHSKHAVIALAAGLLNVPEEILIQQADRITTIPSFCIH